VDNLLYVVKNNLYLDLKFAFAIIPAYCNADKVVDMVFIHNNYMEPYKLVMMEIYFN
jgi:hypothetical protein